MEIAVTSPYPFIRVRVHSYIIENELWKKLFVPFIPILKTDTRPGDIIKRKLIGLPNTDCYQGIIAQL